MMCALCAVYVYANSEIALTVEQKVRVSYYAVYNIVTHTYMRNTYSARRRE